jgi:hypothetical protein
MSVAEGFGGPAHHPQMESADDVTVATCLISKWTVAELDHRAPVLF